MFIFKDFWWTLYKANISIKQSCTNGIHFIEIRLWLLKGTLMQIWKSPYMFVLIQKQYPENFSPLFLRTAELSAREVVDFLKRRLIFNIFCCFKLCKQTFHISHVHISQKSSTYYFHVKSKILADFQICISVPLKDTLSSTKK